MINKRRPDNVLKVIDALHVPDAALEVEPSDGGIVDHGAIGHVGGKVEDAAKQRFDRKSVGKGGDGYGRCGLAVACLEFAEPLVHPKFYVALGLPLWRPKVVGVGTYEGEALGGIDVFSNLAFPFSLAQFQQFGPKCQGRDFREVAASNLGSGLGAHSR